MKKSLAVLISTSSLCLLYGCASGGGATPPVATHFSVTAATSTPTAGTPFNFTVTALDSSNAVVSSYAGTVHFSSSDSKAKLPPDSSVTNGVGTYSATIETLGPQTITATAASITGISSTITVNAPPSPVPFISQPLSPDATLPGGAAFTLTVNGTGFVSGSTLNWNGSPRTTHFVNESQITANILASDIANSNTALVTVANSGGTSNVVFFETTKPTSFATWSPPSALAAGTQPSAVVTADFNRDGKLDMVVTNGGSDNVSILLGNGDGTFQAAVSYSAGTNPSSVAVADFNGDGKLDLAVTDGGSNDVSIFLGKGDGTFQAAVSYPVGNNPSSVAVGDFLGDGKLDLAVANFGSSNVSVLLGKGDGTFQSALEYPAGTGASCVAVGDFNGDGKLDLTVANTTSSQPDVGSVSILIGNGDGTFQPPVNYVTGGDNSNIGVPDASVVVGDFNGDGRLDLAVVDAGSSNFTYGMVSVLLGNGDGTFQAAVGYPTLSRGSSLASGDLNGDGKLDLVVANISGNNSGPSSASVLLGNGDGTFQPATYHAAGDNPSSVAVGDFNGDGRMDLAVTDLSGSTLSVLLYPTMSGPTAALSSTKVSFGTRVVGSTTPGNPVTLSNDGTATLNIVGITASTSFGESDDCGSSLSPGASCTINTNFSPNTIDIVNGTILIADNAPGSPQAIALSGYGTFVKINAAAMNFVCYPPPLVCNLRETAVLTNTGTAPLSINSITTTGVFQESNNCPPSVGAGQTCSITVTFGGQLYKHYTGTLAVADNGGASPQIVPLTGYRIY